MIDTSIIAPRNAQSNVQPGVQPGIQPGASPQGIQPGGIEALRNAIAFLQKQGMNPEQILEMLLKIVERLGYDIPEEQLRNLIETGTTPTGEMPVEGGINV